MDRGNTTRHYLARNLRTLMHWEKITQTALETRTRGAVSQKTISNMLTGEHSPKIESVDAVARAFGLKGWQLTMDYLPEDLDRLKRLGKLIENYIASAPSGRDFIETTAERERKLRPSTRHQPNQHPTP